MGDGVRTEGGHRPCSCRCIRFHRRPKPGSQRPDQPTRPADRARRASYCCRRPLRIVSPARATARCGCGRLSPAAPAETFNSFASGGLLEARQGRVDYSAKRPAIQVSRGGGVIGRVELFPAAYVWWPSEVDRCRAAFFGDATRWDTRLIPKRNAWRNFVSKFARRQRTALKKRIH